MAEQEPVLFCIYQLESTVLHPATRLAAQMRNAKEACWAEKGY